MPPMPPMLEFWPLLRPGELKAAAMREVIKLERMFGLVEKVRNG